MRAMPNNVYTHACVRAYTHAYIHTHIRDVRIATPRDSQVGQLRYKLMFSNPKSVAVVKCGATAIPIIIEGRETVFNDFWY